MPFVSALMANKVNPNPVFAGRKAKEVPLPKVDVDVYDARFPSPEDRERYIAMRREHLGRLMNPGIWPQEVLRLPRYISVEAPSEMSRLADQALGQLARGLSQMAFKDSQPMEPFIMLLGASTQNNFCDTLSLVASRGPGASGYMATEDAALLREIFEKDQKADRAMKQDALREVKQAMCVSLSPSGSLRRSISPESKKVFAVAYEYVSPTGTRIAMEILIDDGEPDCRIEVFHGQKMACLDTNQEGMDEAAVLRVAKKAVDLFTQTLEAAHAQGKLVTMVREGRQFKPLGKKAAIKDYPIRLSIPELE